MLEDVEEYSIRGVERMKVTGRITDISLEFLTGKPKVTFQVDDKSALLSEYDKLKEKDKLFIEVKPYRPKRSNSANAYAWVLMDKIAESQGITKDEVYLHQIQKVGVFKPIEINEDAVDTMIHSWSLHGLGWIAQRIGNSDKKGFVEMALYYGSSSYNTKQMARLIDNIVQECNVLGISTKTPDEIANMLSLWEREAMHG
jgi:hypothetical protein